MERSRAAFLASGHPAGPLIAYSQIEASEYIGYGPDGVCWVLTNAHDGYTTSKVLEGDPSRLHTEVHAVVLNVEDVDECLRVFAEAGGLTVTRDFRMGGDDLVDVLGMRPGASIRFASCCGPDGGPAYIEFMQFFDVDPAPQQPRPLGIRRVCFEVDDPRAMSERLRAAGARSAGRGILVGPVGIEIELRKSSATAEPPAPM
jgi:hypothetical protein